MEASLKTTNVSAEILINLTHSTGTLFYFSHFINAQKFVSNSQTQVTATTYIFSSYIMSKVRYMS